MTDRTGRCRTAPPDATSRASEAVASTVIAGMPNLVVGTEFPTRPPIDDTSMIGTSAVPLLARVAVRSRGGMVGRGRAIEQKGRKEMTTTSSTTHTILRAEGFSCPSCVNKIEKRVGRLDGVESVKVQFASARIEVDHDESKVSVDDLVAAVAKAGYKAAPSAF